MNSINQNITSTQLSRPIWPGLIVALIIAVSLSGIMDHDLWTPDEPREAAIALGMIQHGNLIVPELAGQPFVEKPPLFYITASLFLRSLGPFLGNTAALRLVSACFGLFTLFFTYLIGRIYFDRQKALIAAGILATMIGFVHVTHWLLVDNALMFFITATVWALAKAYENNRFSYLPLAGILAAFAFLSKGMIGPLIIFIAWLGIFLPWLKQNGWQTCLSKINISFCAFHSAGAIIAIIISTVWITAFALKGDPELFREWWWTNHFGRFTGTANQLGHISPWYYYFSVLPVYLLPWIAPFIAAIIFFLIKIFRGEPMPNGARLFIFWVLGAFLLLSLSATKRDIYLSALLPACALLCIYGLDLSLPAITGSLLRHSATRGRVASLLRPEALRARDYEGPKAEDRAGKVGGKIYWLWMLLLFMVLAAFIAAPLVGSEFFGLSFISFTFGWRQILALATVFISLLALARITAPFIQRFLVVATMCYSTLLVIICPVVDGYKSYGTAFRLTADAIRSRPELKVAGWNLDETTVAGFYYYCGLVFTSIPDQKMLDDILQGRNFRFNGALALEKNASPNDLPDKENQVIFKSRMGKRRLLQLFAAPDWKKKGRIKNAE